MFQQTRNERKNAEGYSDPTAYEAITNIDRRSKERKTANVSFDPENSNAYAEFKISMLISDFLITPTDEEARHLRSLNNEADIDRATRTIIKRHWEEN